MCIRDSTHTLTHTEYRSSTLGCSISAKYPSYDTVHLCITQTKSFQQEGVKTRVTLHKVLHSTTFSQSCVHGTYTLILHHTPTQYTLTCAHTCKIILHHTQHGTDVWCTHTHVFTHVYVYRYMSMQVLHRHTLYLHVHCIC